VIVIFKAGSSEIDDKYHHFEKLIQEIKVLGIGYWVSLTISIEVLEITQAKLNCF